MQMLLYAIFSRHCHRRVGTLCLGRRHFPFASGGGAPIITAMKASLNSVRGPLGRLAISIWFVGLAVGALAQTAEVDEVRKHAEAGLVEAQNTLGLIYRSGTGVTQDFAQALKWFQKAADQGYASAQKNLGLMYAEGKGVKADVAEAVKWLRKAADQNYASAQTYLAMLYLDGKAQAQEAGEAVRWLRKAAEAQLRRGAGQPGLSLPRRQRRGAGCQRGR